jgi:hypothetical protein
MGTVTLGSGLRVLCRIQVISVVVLRLRRFFSIRVILPWALALKDTRCIRTSIEKSMTDLFGLQGTGEILKKMNGDL